MLNKQRRKHTRARFDVVRFVYKYFPEAKLAASGKEFLLECPWHDGHKRKLYVNAASGVYNCFVCGARGGFFSFVRRVVGVAETADVTKLLTEIDNDTDTDYESYFEAPQEVREFKSISYPDFYYPLWGTELGESGRAAERYLMEKRGLTRNQIAYYKLGFCYGGRYSQRIIIPTFGPFGELVTYVGRDYTGNSTLKVLNPPEVDGESNKNWVFNLYPALRTGHLIITEGVFDAMGVGVSGVALFGKKATDTQLSKILFDAPLRITCCLDADASEDNEALAGQLSGILRNVYVAKLPHSDPADLAKDDPEALKYAILRAERYEPRWASF